MKKVILVSILALFLLPSRLGAQNQTALPSAGLTPESPFYFLDRLGEALQEFFTFNPEAKAHLQITFAAERVAEIKIILETKGVNAKGLEVAQSRLQSHLADAATIVTDQKAKGKDVSQLAKELDDEFDAPKTALEQTFKDEERALEAKEKELKAKIRSARQAVDTAQVEALIKELSAVKAQKELLDAKNSDQEKAIENENEKIKEEIDAKTEAEKVIRDNQSGKQEILGEAAKDNITVPAEMFGKFDELLAQAKSALAAGNYEEAKRLAKQAEKSLDAAEKAIENLKEAKDNEEEIKADEEERTQEIKNDREEKAREGAKKESENLKESQKKAEEKTKKADEQLQVGNEKNGEQVEGGKERASQSAVSLLSQNWTVKFENGRFNPAELKIKKGDTVTWVNKSDSLMWPASAFHPTHQVYPGFDALKSLNMGESYSFKFDRVGSWKYHNHLSTSVTGVIVVEE